MDEPNSSCAEWRRKNVLPALRDLYDEIWIYGLPQICDPLEGLRSDAECARRSPIPDTSRAKCRPRRATATA